MLTILALYSCNQDKQASAQTELNNKSTDCIRYILSQDDSLGKIRNEASFIMPLSASIHNYTSDLQALNYKLCPTDFTIAFNNHIKAWQEMIPTVDPYSEMRGEMHYLFKEIENLDPDQFNLALENIWDTWDVVEKSKLQNK